MKKTGHPSYSSIVAKTLIRQARKDPRVVVITAAMCEGTGMTEFQKEFPTRLIDVGIAEQHAMTYAAGLSAAQMRPVICMYSTFLQRAYDQVVHDVATQNLPVTSIDLKLEPLGYLGDSTPGYLNSR